SGTGFLGHGNAWRARVAPLPLDLRCVRLSGRTVRTLRDGNRKIASLMRPDGNAAASRGSAATLCTCALTCPVSSPRVGRGSIILGQVAGDCGGARGHVKLLVDRLEVVLDGVLRQAEAGGDLEVRQPLLDQRHDLVLAL